MEWNLADIFESMADAFPERLALVCGDREVTFGELDRLANRMANVWLDAGLGPESHVGLYLYNGWEYVVAMLAAWKIRARTINLNYRYVADELRYVKDDANLTGVLYEAELAEHVRGAGLDAVPLSLARGPELDAALDAASEARPDVGPRSQDDVFILYTGGTTGMPKGVMWRHEDLFFAALQGGQPGGEPFNSPDEMAPLLKEYGGGIHIHTAAPLIHGSSQLASWIAMFNGGLAILVPGKSYDPVASLDLCDRYEAHTMNFVGDAMALPLVEALEAHPGRWTLEAMDVISSAGAVLSGHVRERLEALLPSTMVMNNFGSSETGHQGTAFYDEGKPIWVMDDTHTKVLDDDLNEVQPGSGVVGKLARFGHIPLGYWQDEAKTATTFVTAPDGTRYVIPGDMATVDEDGTIVFLGRGSVCINSGGEKVYAEEVEEAVKAHPAVFDCVVVGVPDDRWGQRVEAVLTLRDGQAFDRDDVDAFVKTKVAAYKRPRAYWVVDDLHRQPSGKPNYGWARETAIALGTGA